MCMIEVIHTEEVSCDPGELCAQTRQPNSISSFDARFLAVAPVRKGGSRHQMYESFFKLQKTPFGMNPDPSCLFMTPSHREAFAGLVYAISRRKGFVVLTGDAGTGKTSLLRALIRSTDSTKFSVILTPRLNSDEFLELALLDFGVSDVPVSKSQRIHKLQEVLLELRLQGTASVLMVDEAHTLSPETLEEIRLLTNFETTDEKLLQIVLAGQNDLAATLNREDLRQLKQRIEVRMDLKPLASTDVGAYMRYRWSRAGGSEPLPFSEEAIVLIATASRGIPRLVNSICDNALLLGYASQESSIGPAHIRQVLRDFDLGEAEPTGKNGRRSTNEGASQQDIREDNPPKRSAIAPRPLLGAEDDPPSSLKPPLVLRWADKMNLGSIQSRKRSREQDF
jgi:general secretion pathway protein A